MAYNDIDPEMAHRFDLPVSEGVLAMAASSPAERDSIIAAGGVTVKDGGDLRRAIRSLRVGEMLWLKVFRQGREMEASAGPPERPAPYRKQTAFSQGSERFTGRTGGQAPTRDASRLP